MKNVPHIFIFHHLWDFHKKLGKFVKMFVNYTNVLNIILKEHLLI